MQWEDFICTNTFASFSPKIWFHRFIWLCLVLGTISSLFFIVGFNIERFLGYPISSRVTLKYTENLTFPAVTICNYNQWRKSVVQAENSDFVNKFFFPVLSRNDSFDVGDYNVTDINITAEVLRGAHQKENMIVDCSWRSVEPCSYLNFTQVITDFGVCYTFNNPPDLSNSLTVRQTGYEHGLFLRLNLEQYDYFYGERKGAGFKVIFIFSFSFLPLVLLQIAAFFCIFFVYFISFFVVCLFVFWQIYLSVSILLHLYDFHVLQ